MEKEDRSYSWLIWWISYFKDVSLNTDKGTELHEMEFSL